jgi:hypothetical protein
VVVAIKRDCDARFVGGRRSLVQKSGSSRSEKKKKKSERVAEEVTGFYLQI